MRIYIILYSIMTTVDKPKSISCIRTYICGCARNCAKYLPSVLTNMKQIGDLFDDYQIVISYDHSTDTTLQILESMKGLFFPTMEIIMGNPDERTAVRTQNISRARNRILDYIESRSHDQADYAYMIMMDMDDVCAGRMNLDVLQKHVDQERVERVGRDVRVGREGPSWDALSFNRREYYDIWALSLDPYMFSCWNYSNAKVVVQKMQTYVQDTLQQLLKKAPDQLLRCSSAFNGLAIYRLKAFAGSRYEWSMDKVLPLFSKAQLGRSTIVTGGRILRTKENADCEHRYFHMRATELNGARICISPHYLFTDFIGNGVVSDVSSGRGGSFGKLHFS